MPVAAPGTKVAAAAPVEEELPLAAVVSDAPPKPVTGGRVDVVAAEPVADAVDAEELSEALPLKGSWAPQGWSSRQADTQVLSPPQFSVH